MNYFWLAVRAVPILAAWIQKAMADGRVTAGELAELVANLGGLLGIPTDIDVPAFDSALPPRGAVPPAPTIRDDGGLA